MSVNWNGILPAITTKFNEDYSVDYGFFAEHCSWLIDSGCVGIVPNGSLGEGATLSFDEKMKLVRTAADAVGSRASIVPGIAALSTAEAVRLAQASEANGATGLMVLPPYVYSSDWREMKAHVDAVTKATKLPVMLYNNPLAYGTDFLPVHIAELAHEHDNFAAVKESSADTRRIRAIYELLDDRVKVLVGVDDSMVEGVVSGAVGWIAGLVDALPVESVALFNMAVEARDGGGDRAKLEALYRWFLPLLRLDVGTKFVQQIKLTQQMLGKGSARVRPPRLELAGEELERVSAIIQHAIDTRPQF
jgi:dihydrodipicolinate synthase/N-acetylneuraminate lyase